MNHGGSWNFDFGKVKYVNAIHSSSFPDGTNGNPGGFVIEGEHKTSTSREIRHYGHEIDSNAY
jgi:hypothetical protein